MTVAHMQQALCPHEHSLQRHIGKRYMDALQAAGRVPVFRR
jgi:hypothetical protein